MLNENSAPEVARLFGARWWVPLLRGIVAIAFGCLAFASPGVTMATLVLLFGAYALVDGVFSLVTAIGGRHRSEDRWLLALEGIVGILAGVVILRAPGLTSVALIFFISIWAMATGFLRIAASIRLRKEISGEVWLALSGVVAILFALMLFFWPTVGVVWLAWMIAGYAVILGMCEIILGVQLRSLRAA